MLPGFKGPGLTHGNNSGKSGAKLFFDKDPKDPVLVDKLLKHFEKYGKYKQLAVHYIWEDLFWRREREHIPWLEKEIRT